MQRPRNHYDNLKVAQNAPPEVIKAAYKVLCQKYHPDINGDTERNKRAMQIINIAYAVLSDPIKRKEHDEWIAQKDEIFKQDREAYIYEESIKRPEAVRPPPPPIDQKYTNKKVRNYDYIIVISIIIVFFVANEIWQEYGKRKNTTNYKNHTGWNQYEPLTNASPPVYKSNNTESGDSYTRSNDKSGITAEEFDRLIGYNPKEDKSGMTEDEFMQRLKEIDAEKKAEQGEKDRRATSQKQGISEYESNKYTKPAHAPNGTPWPQKADYVSGYPIRMATGLSSVTVDNTKNDSDVFVKLFMLRPSDNKGTSVRSVFIPAFGSFTINKITQGRYDIRYQDLDNGGFSKTDAFILEEAPTYSGIQYSSIRLTLYKVQNGNMQMKKITPRDFE